MNTKSPLLTNKLFRLLYSKPMIFAISIVVLLSFCYLDFSPTLKEVIKIAAISLTSICAFLYLARRKISKQAALLMIMFAIELLATILGEDASVKNFIFLYIRLLGFYLYLEIGFRQATSKTLSGLSSSLWVLVLVNSLTIILFPKGLYESVTYTANWFFQYDNLHIIWYLAAICVSYINYKVNSTKRVQLLSLLAMTTFSVIFCMSANSVVAYAILLSYLLLAKYIDEIKVLNYRTYLFIFILLNIGFVFLRVQNLFAWFIVGILGKSLTFTDRTIIWDRAINLTAEKPLLGHGLEPNEIFTAKYGSPYYTHAHNTILDISYKSGIVSALVFMKLLFSLDQEIRKCRNERIRNFISIILFCLMLMMIFEARQEKIGLYIILAIASCAEYYVICQKQNKKGERKK